MTAAGQSLASPRDGVAATLHVDILRDDGAWPQGAVDDALLTRALIAAFVAADGRGECEVALKLTGDEDIRKLNRDWRGKDAATNVLSFPLDAPPAPPGMVHMLGDIVLAWETVAREAEDKAMSVADHAAHLAVHGLLHILGFGHDEEESAARMEQLETGILAGLGIADPYAIGEPAASRTV